MEDSIGIKKGFSVKIFEVFDICQQLIDCGLLLLKTVQDSERVRLSSSAGFFCNTARTAEVATRWSLIVNGS